MLGLVEGRVDGQLEGGMLGLQRPLDVVEAVDDGRWIVGPVGCLSLRRPRTIYPKKLDYTLLVAPSAAGRFVFYLVSPSSGYGAPLPSPVSSSSAKTAPPRQVALSRCIGCSHQ